MHSNKMTIRAEHMNTTRLFAGLEKLVRKCRSGNYRTHEAHFLCPYVQQRLNIKVASSFHIKEIGLV